MSKHQQKSKPQNAKSVALEQFHHGLASALGGYLDGSAPDMGLRLERAMNSLSELHKHLAEQFRQKVFYN